MDSGKTLDRQPFWRSYRFRQVLGCAFAAGCLAWVLHDVRLSDLTAHVANLDWRWVWLAVAFDILSYVFQGWRWQLLLEPLGGIHVLRTTQAIYAGLFTNELLPMRIGEFVRAFLVSRWLDVPVSSTVASLLVERLLDAVWLAVTLGITALVMPLPVNLARAGDVLGIGVLLAVGVFVVLVLRGGPGSKTGLFARLHHDLANIGLSKRLAGAALSSLLLLVAQIAAFWLIMEAYGLNLSFWAGAVVLLIVHLGTAIPNAPANVGSYQFFCVLGLQMFGVDKTSATAFSIVVFFLLTVPLWLLGFTALSRSGFGLRTIRRELSYSDAA